MKQILLILALALQTANLYAYATCTNIIDIAALAACGTGTTNGWTLAGIDSYADKNSNIRLSEITDYLESPEYPSNIVRIVLVVKSSSQTGRKLTFFPFVTNQASAENAVSCGYSQNKDTYVQQALEFPETLPVKRFRIAFDNPRSGSTGWGISYLAVITSTEPRFASPESVFARCIHASTAELTWGDNPLVASYLVAASSVTHYNESFSIYSSCDFELCTNSLDNDSQNKSEQLHNLYPEFSAEKIYYPANSKGVIRVSIERENGRLTHIGYPNYQKMAIEITAKRHPDDKNCAKIYAYYLDAEQPHEIGSMAIDDDFSTGRIPLDDVPDGASINIGNLDGTKSNRRFLIDRIAFLQDYTPAYLTTNLLYTTVVPKGTPCRLTGLTRSSEYLVTVTAIDKNGQHAKPSAPILFSTAEKDTGTMIWCR